MTEVLSGQGYTDCESHRNLGCDDWGVILTYVDCINWWLHFVVYYSGGNSSELCYGDRGSQSTNQLVRSLGSWLQLTTTHRCLLQ